MMQPKCQNNGQKGKLDQQKKQKETNKKHLLDLFDEFSLAPISSISPSTEKRALAVEDEDSSSLLLISFSKSLLPDFLTGLVERVNNDLLRLFELLLSGVDFLQTGTRFCVGVSSLHLFFFIFLESFLCLRRHV